MYLIICLGLGEAASEQREKNRMQSAHISRCWIKYCLNLLEDAKKLLEVQLVVMHTIALFISLKMTISLFVSPGQHG